MTFQPNRSAATRTASLLSGAIDANVEVPLQDIPRLLQDSRVQVIEGPELRTIYLGFDHERDELLYSDVRGRNPLRDRRVREAIYRAIDVNALVRTVMREKAWPAGMMVSPFLTGAPQDLNARLPFDPDAARRLLAEANCRASRPRSGPAARPTATSPSICWAMRGCRWRTAIPR